MKHKFKKGGKPMLTLSFWEQFIVQAAVSLLTVLDSQIKNATEKAALQAAITFLQKLLGGLVSGSVHRLEIRVPYPPRTAAPPADAPARDPDGPWCEYDWPSEYSEMKGRTSE